MTAPIRLAVFASGKGTNFSALAAFIEQELPQAQIVRLIVDHAHVPVIDRAAKHDVPVSVIKYSAYADKSAAEKAILAILDKDQAQGILLAGFMRIIGPDLLAAFPNKIINIHPALLPSFPGRQGIADAFDYGVKVTGVTIHFVDSGVDSGKIIAQAAVPIADGETLAEVETHIHEVEHRLYPQTLKKLIKKGVFTA
ncbi:phosphoribosylglycinamide formyltransferase [Oenococcus kitaharae]|uniref:Phosphoribosylglycinamide formyltransferase n=1 Tax=Oenococcus kitaharae DSM 17330 TaxID=1045004 RepID=G9WH12_9LACO|nr:phosphoribosylglycinamide formyltransferase [Oenococcus kitaharae]EHN59420.1 Phosphoribosylglycinamide formyltransferase [Oenococcus kitaharae DSM 17330]OEY83294.1 phosphoribosylglycinamide formyltransferase [Oenococcus kitaharae]OEY85092.1 phosphoribosylglycinamide formyltransferase [Oenococcus kitaharae]OEY85947.1 phosphoribosylglycinamide formyltransferase [Oenococcus kitaharae]